MSNHTNSAAHPIYTYSIQPLSQYNATISKTENGSQTVAAKVKQTNVVSNMVE
jgi:hypothetical protein